MKVSKGLALTAFRVASDHEFYLEVRIFSPGSQGHKCRNDDRHFVTGQREFRGVEERLGTGSEAVNAGLSN